MRATPRPTWATGLTATLAALYGWIGLAAHDSQRALAWIGAALIAAALLVARRSAIVAGVVLAAGAVPLAVAAWWSITAPLVGALALGLGAIAIRDTKRAATRTIGTGDHAPDRT